MNFDNAHLRDIQQLLSTLLERDVKTVSVQDIKAIVKEECQTGTRSNILSTLLDLLKTKIRVSDCSTKIEILEFTDSFSFQRQEEAIQIFKDAIAYEGAAVETPSFDQTLPRITHQDVINSIAWPLFITARFVEDEKIRVDVFDLFLKLLQYESKENIRYFDESKSAPILLSRLFFEEEWSNQYSNILTDQLSNYCKALISEIDLSPKFLTAFKIMYSGALNCERRFTSWVNDGQIQITQFSIVPQSAGWDSVVHFLNFGKRIIERSKSKPEVIEIAISAYTNMISSLNRSILPEGGKDRESTDLVQDFFKKEFVWTREIITKANFSEQHKRLIRNAWDWHRNYSTNKELQELANECEAVYFQSEDLDHFKNLFDFSSPELVKTSEEYFSSKLISTGDIDEVWDFIKNAEKFGGGGHSHLHTYANIIWKFGNSKENGKLKSTFIEQGFVSKDFFQIAMICLNGFLKQLRDDHNTQEIEQQLNHYLRKSHNSDTYFSGLYNSIHKEYIGDLSEVDFRFFMENGKSISERIRATLYSSFCLSFWDRISITIDECWESLSRESRCLAIGNVVERITIFWNQYSFQIDKNKMEWITSKTFSLPDIDLLKNYDFVFKKILDLSKFKHSIEWFFESIDERFKAAALDDKIRVFPRYFDCTKFIDLDLSRSTDVEAIRIFIDKFSKDYYKHYRSEEILTSVDKEGVVVGPIVAEKIHSFESFDEILHLASIAGHYKDTQPGWTSISLASCKQSKYFTPLERRKIYSELMWKGIRSYSSAYNQVAKKYYDDLEHAKSQLANADEILKEYWELQLSIAENELAREVSMLRKDESGGTNA